MGKPGPIDQRTGRALRRVAATLGTLALASAGVALSATPGDAAPTAQPFTVGTSTFQVPAGVCSISVDALGAQGGSGTGGLGGEASASIPVIPGEVLQVRVGGQGSGGPGGSNGSRRRWSRRVVDRGRRRTWLYPHHRREPLHRANQRRGWFGYPGGRGGWFGGGGGNASQAGQSLFIPGGGGGGSGHTPTGTGLTNGVRAADGLVTITFDPAARTCVSPAVVVVVAPRFTG